MQADRAGVERRGEKPRRRKAERPRAGDFINLASRLAPLRLRVFVTCRHQRLLDKCAAKPDRICSPVFAAARCRKPPIGPPVISPDITSSERSDVFPPDSEKKIECSALSNPGTPPAQHSSLFGRTRFTTSALTSLPLRPTPTVSASPERSARAGPDIGRKALGIHWSQPE